MILETERLVLRPIVTADWRELYPIMSDPQVMAHWDGPEIVDPEISRRMVAAQVEDMQAGAAHYWAVELGAAAAFLGACELTGIDWRHRRAEVGFVLARAAWGLGYGLEAMRAVVGHAASLGLKRLWARTHAGNERSERLLARLGFEAEGYLRGHVQRAGERRDCRSFGLLL
ncbi:MAG TPA: GNAT family N-acetyltransferase [Caulobacteraceae bacterium]|nr:GNAT family N-acetyltransferase [Caulobacteraceae bacterium]